MQRRFSHAIALINKLSTKSSNARNGAASYDIDKKAHCLLAVYYAAVLVLEAGSLVLPSAWHNLPCYPLGRQLVEKSSRRYVAKPAS